MQAPDSGLPVQSERRVLRRREGQVHGFREEEVNV